MNLMKQKEILIEELVKKAKKLADEYGNIDLGIQSDSGGSTYGIDAHGNLVLFIDGTVAYECILEGVNIENIAYILDEMIAIEKGEMTVENGIIASKKK